jgi:hypothetical protein
MPDRPLSFRNFREANNDFAGRLARRIQEPMMLRLLKDPKLREARVEPELVKGNLLLIRFDYYTDAKDKAGKPLASISVSPYVRGFSKAPAYLFRPWGKPETLGKTLMQDLIASGPWPAEEVAAELRGAVLEGVGPYCGFWALSKANPAYAREFLLRFEPDESLPASGETVANALLSVVEAYGRRYLRGAAGWTAAETALTYLLENVGKLPETMQAQKASVENTTCLQVTFRKEAEETPLMLAAVLERCLLQVSHDTGPSSMDSVAQNEAREGMERMARALDPVLARPLGDPFTDRFLESFASDDYLGMLGYLLHRTGRDPMVTELRNRVGHHDRER